MAGKRSRQLTDNDIHDGKLPDAYSYCRVCQSIKTEQFFGVAVDLDLDKNGKMSICKNCINDLFAKTMITENNSIQRSTLKMCRKLNIKYDEQAIDAALVHIQTKQSDPTKFFNLYRAKLLITSRTSTTESSKDVDLTYQDNPIVNVDNKNILLDDAFEEARDLKIFWRTGDKSDLEFLENEFANFKKTNKADTHAETVLLKEVCFKLLDMDKDRRAGKSTDSSLKQLMNVMEKLLISPNTVNAANSGDNLDSFGKWISDIEKYEPAEWLEKEGKPLYKDVDDIEGYFQKFCVRPLRNFILQSKDFNIDDETLESSDTDIFEDSIIEGIDEKSESPTISE